MAGQQMKFKEMQSKIRIPMDWSTGNTVGRFLTEIRDNCRICGIRCGNCGKVMVPPQDYCFRCAIDADEWVVVDDKGTLLSHTLVHQTFPEQPCSPPYVLGLIKLDGADTAILHLIRKVGKTQVNSGIRVQAVWNDKREGNIFDIAYFKPIGGQGD
jgi:uncharacterized OB-fold protein